MTIFNGEYCVYCHTNKINDKKYIGQTKLSPNKRWGAKGEKYKGCRYFYAAIQKYGWDNFSHEIIASNLTLEEANSFEELLINKLETQSHDKGYNIAYGGNNKLFTDETKEMLSHQRSGGKNCNAKMVICDDVLYDYIGACAEHYNVNRRLMNGWLLEELPMPEYFISKKLRFANKDFSYKKETGSLRGRDNNKSRAVLCNGKIFETVHDCAEFYNIKFNTMYNWLTHSKNMPQKFIEMGLKFVNDTKEHKSQFNGKKVVVCDGIVYSTIREFSCAFNLRENCVSRWLSGSRKMPLIWQQKGLKYMEGDDNGITN